MVVGDVVRGSSRMIASVLREGRGTIVSELWPPGTERSSMAASLPESCGKLTGTRGDGCSRGGRGDGIESGVMSGEPARPLHRGDGRHLRAACSRAAACAGRVDLLEAPSGRRHSR